MVYLALTARGLQDILDAPEASNIAIWCSADALSHAEFEKLKPGTVTRFNYSFMDASIATLETALSTIEDHHPGERVWVESILFENGKFAY
jgi:hypothetical protein